MPQDAQGSLSQRNGSSPDLTLMCPLLSGKSRETLRDLIPGVSPQVPGTANVSRPTAPHHPLVRFRLRLLRVERIVPRLDVYPSPARGARRGPCGPYRQHPGILPRRRRSVLDSRYAARGRIPYNRTQYARLNIWVNIWIFQAMLPAVSEINSRRITNCHPRPPPSFIMLWHDDSGNSCA